MITKTIRAETMMIALETVQKDLGPEALIVSVRQVPGGPIWQVWKNPVIEVVAVQMDENEKKSGAAMPQAASGKSAAAALPDKHTKSWASNKKYPQEAKVNPVKPELSGMTIPVEIPETPVKAASEIKRSTPLDLNEFIAERIKLERAAAEPKPVVHARPALTQPKKVEVIEEDQVDSVKKVVAQLKNQGIDPELVDKIAKVCAETMPMRSLEDEGRLTDSFAQQMETCIRDQKDVAHRTPKVVFLVGSSGAGKTSTTAKLAAHYSRKLGRKVVWVCADTIRTGAIAEARNYAETMGVPLRLAYTPAELAAVVEAESTADLILIDTSACNPRNEKSMVELGGFITAIPNRAIWLVMPATGRDVDMMTLTNVMKPFQPRGLIITKMDETDMFGTAFNTASRSQIPLVYFTCGTRVVLDLVPAEVDLLTRAVFEGRFMA
jgi:flagellar biosynthesis protein FlhF